MNPCRDMRNVVQVMPLTTTAAPSSRTESVSAASSIAAPSTNPAVDQRAAFTDPRDERPGGQREREHAKAEQRDDERRGADVGSELAGAQREQRRDGAVPDQR